MKITRKTARDFDNDDNKHNGEYALYFGDKLVALFHIHSQLVVFHSKKVIHLDDFLEGHKDKNVSFFPINKIKKPND